MAIYYVDYDGGSDTANGTSVETAWKHCPGDPAATGNPGSATLQGGDCVRFRGGVVYRGQITAGQSGGVGNPISYQGNKWGISRAVFDGSELLTGSWTKCASASECKGNPNWEHIYYISAPEGFGFFAGLFEDDAAAYMSQWPQQDDPFFYDRTEQFHTIDLDNEDNEMTRTSITEPVVFTQTDTSFWTGAYVGVWRIPNVVAVKAITGYVEGTLSFEDIGGDLYSGDGLYTLLNSPFLIDTAGEYAFSEGKIWFWPFDSGSPSGHTYTYGKRAVGMQLGTKSNIVVEGFVIQRFFGGPGDFNDGAGIRIVSSGVTSSHITMQDNEIRQLRSLEKKGAVTISGNAEDIRVEFNDIHDNQRNGGILAGGTGIIVKGNSVRRVATGITFMEAISSRILGNEVRDILHTHSNGISVYLNSSKVLVAHNRVQNAPYYAMTIQSSEDITIFGNILDGGEGTCKFAEFNGTSGGQIALLHNLIIGNDTHNAVSNFGNYGANSYVMMNNIIDGGGAAASITRAHNIYLSLRWDQDARYGWYLGDGEFVEEDQQGLFVSPAARNFHLAEGSGAIDAGTDISDYLPTDDFPDFDFSLDFSGNSRTADGYPDIGAFEFGSWDVGQLGRRKRRQTVYKNTASQKLAVYAYNSATGAPVSGDAANITGLISKDGGEAAATNDVNPAPSPTMAQAGVYYFDLTQAETNADLVVVSASSTTENVRIDPVIIEAITAATSSALATAQADLDVLTGSDGATLATAQAKYAPAKAGDKMDLVNAPNATAVSALKTGLGMEKVQAAVYDSATVSGNTITLSNGATQTKTVGERVTVEP